MKFPVHRSDGARPKYLPGRVGSFVFLAILSLSACGEDYTFERQWQDAHKKADTILAANNLCSSKIPCPNGGVLFYGPLEGGISVEVYGIQDQKLLFKVIEPFIQEFYETLEMKNLSVKAYAFSKNADVNPPFIKRIRYGTILNIDMRRQS